MTEMQLLGAAMLALPFVAVFVFVAVSEGVRMAIEVYAITAALIALVAIGSLLVMGEWR